MYKNLNYLPSLIFLLYKVTAYDEIITMENEDQFEKDYVLNYMTANDEIITMDDQDQFEKDYVLKHIGHAKKKFNHLESFLLKYIFIAWYILDHISINPNTFTQYFSPLSGDQFFHIFITNLIESYSKAINHGDDYKAIQLRKYLNQVYDLDASLGSMFTDNKVPIHFLLRLKGCIDQFEIYDSVSIRSIVALFQSIRENIKPEFFEIP